MADEVDLDFLWEVAGQEEFGFAELGAEYFGHAPLPHEAAGLVLTLHAAPIYFYKKGKRPLQGRAGSVAEGSPGRHRKEEAAGAGAGRSMSSELKAGRLPDAMQPLVAQLLFKPDKNTHRIQGARRRLQRTADHAAAR